MGIVGEKNQTGAGAEKEAREAGGVLVEQIVLVGIILRGGFQHRGLSNHHPLLTIEQTLYVNILAMGLIAYLLFGRWDILHHVEIEVGRHFVGTQGEGVEVETVDISHRFVEALLQV